MPLDAATRQRLLELAYELLPEAEAAALRDQIASDTELGVGFAAAQRQAAMMAAAAKLTGPTMTFVPPRPPVAPPPAQPPRHDRGTTSRLAQWSMVAAALVLAAVSLGGYFYHQQQLASLATPELRLFVAGPPRVQSGVPAEFTVVATDAVGAFVTTDVELSLVSADDRQLWHARHATDAAGRMQAVVPATLAIPPGARLVVAAGEGAHTGRVQTPLPTAPVEYVTRLTLDRHQYRAGEKVFCRSVSLSRFALRADREFAVRLELLDPNGKPLPGGVEGTTQSGVGNAALALPERAVSGQYKLVARALDEAFPTASLAFDVEGGAAAEKPDAGASEGEAVVVRFYPEGGELAADLENRVYFTARDKAGRPMDLQGRIVDASGMAVALVETQRDGRGVFRLRPARNRQYRLEIVEPKGITQQPKLPAVATEQRVVLSAGTGVFAASRPLEFNVRAAKDGIPLVAVAACRGVVVAQQPLVTDVSGGGANPVSLTVPDEVSGVVRLTLFDYSSSPPEPIAERLVYRRPARRLDLRANNLKKSYLPGEKVELALAVVDEQQRKAAATLGALATETREALSPSLPADLLLLGDIDDPQNLEDADFLLAQDAPAEAALDLVLGTHGWRRFVASAVAGNDDARKPTAASLLAADAPLVVDNLPQLRRDYESRLADYRAQRSRWLSNLATLCAFGGLALVLSVAMLGLLRVIAGAHVWTAAIGATACALAVAAALVERNGLLRGNEMAVAFAPYQAPSEPPRAKETETLRYKMAAAPQAAPLAKRDRALMAAAATPPSPMAAKSEGEGKGTSAGKGETKDETGSPPKPRGVAGGALRKANDMQANRRAVDKAVEKVEAQAANDARQLDAAALADRGRTGDALAKQRFVLREFAREPSVEKQSRLLSPTLLWQPLIAVDASGQARLVFQLPDVPGDVWLTVDGHSAGRLGALRTKFVVAPKE